MPPRQAFITFMDALKLRLRAKDQLHPLLQDLVTGYARFKGSKDWEGRSKMVGWYVASSITRYPSLP
jgi:ESCRT-I complex subunit VPS28